MFRAEVLDLRREVSRGARLVQPALEVAMYSFGPADRVISFRSILSASLVDWHDGLPFTRTHRTRLHRLNSEGDRASNPRYVDEK